MVSPRLVRDARLEPGRLPSGNPDRRQAVARRGPGGGRATDEPRRRFADIPETDPGVHEHAGYREAGGYLSVLAVPMLREGQPIGAIASRRRRGRTVLRSGRSTLLQTFADQAVIAIENVRLFPELETRNRELAEALEQQTATGEILRVIASSPTDLQPSFDAMPTARPGCAEPRRASSTASTAN